jgi:hypothetical protein
MMGWLMNRERPPVLATNKIKELSSGRTLLGEKMVDFIKHGQKNIMVGRAFAAAAARTEVIGSKSRNLAPLPPRLASPYFKV